MTLFIYKVFDKKGESKTGQIDSHTKESAIISLQARGYIISSIKGNDEKSFLERTISLGGVSNKEVVILSKQLSILFDAQISAIRVFRMIAEGNRNDILRNTLTEIADDISDGSSISNAMKKHPKVFSNFFVSMIAAGEESGQLSKTFGYLSDYLERMYAVVSKVKGALIYPSFVVAVFIAVLYLMLTLVIPKISEVLVTQGQELPFITEIVLGASSFLVNYGFIFIGILVVGGYFMFAYIKTREGKESFDRFKIKLPLFGGLINELFIARVSGSMSMLLTSGVSMVKSLENTSKVVNNVVYENILVKVINDVKGGDSLSKSFSKHEDFPYLFINMVKAGEESGKLSGIFDIMSIFYEKEVINRVSQLISLIEPIMITMLGIGVGGLLASVIIPIFSVTNSPF